MNTVLFITISHEHELAQCLLFFFLFFLHNVLKTLLNPLGTIADTEFRNRNSPYGYNFQVS